VTSDEQLFGRARAYLDALEADRQAALVLSEQKAEEAKLTKARQEGFRTAMEMLGEGISVGQTATDPVGDTRADPKSKGPDERRSRRRIPELILRELSFSGQSMTTGQIAKAIDYIPERTETALARMEEEGHVLRDGGRWTIGTTALTHMNGHALSAGNGKSDNRRMPSGHQTAVDPTGKWHRASGASKGQ
jgi:hypothetical protein